MSQAQRQFCRLEANGQANLIAYLRSQADQPPALPTSDEIAAESQ